MNIEVTYRWVEKNVIPPRCRNPRDVTHEATTTFTPIEITADEAPVAIRRFDEATRYEHNRQPSEYRWWRGQLYRPCEYTYRDAPLIEQLQWDLKDLLRGGGHQYDTEEQALAGLAQWANDHPVIDGVRWETSEEPTLEVKFLHPSSMRDWEQFRPSVWVGVSHPFDREAKNDTYAATEYELAKAKVDEAVATGEWENPYPEPPLEVLIPEAIKRNPQTEAALAAYNRRCERAREYLSQAIRGVDGAADALKPIDNKIIRAYTQDLTKMLAELRLMNEGLQ